MKILQFARVITGVFAITIFPVALSQAAEFSMPLIAGQHIPVGNVHVSNTEDEIIITFVTGPEWMIVETHVDIAVNYEGLNTTKKGNPRPGKFRYSAEQSSPANEVVYQVPLAQWPEAESLVIATHAVVESGSQNETAWAGDIAFPGANWATYFMYLVQEEDIPETGVLSFAQNQFEANEQPRGNTVVTIPVIRDSGSSGQISVSFRTVDGTATAGIDYVATQGVLVFEDQETEKSFSVTILNDNDIDPDETIILELFDSCCLGEPVSAAVLIIDDESSN